MKRVLRVSLVIAVYNQLLHTMQCLESMLRLPDKAGEIIVVDNASTDGTPEYLNSVGVTVIRNANNLGCAKAWNQGIQASKGDVIGILSNDSIVTSGWLQAAITGSAFIRHFGMITQGTVKHTGSKAYPAQNVADFRRKWGRTVRGNWLQRRWASVKERWTERYERFWYGHTLVERG